LDRRTRSLERTAAPLSVRGRAAVRTRLVRSTVPVVGGRSVPSLGASRARSARANRTKWSRTSQHRRRGRSGPPGPELARGSFSWLASVHTKPTKNTKRLVDGCGEFERLGTFGRFQMRHRESEMERLTRALERTAAPPCRYYGLGDSEVAGFGGRRGRAAVAQLWSFA
jgi:hypothetical protein